MKADVKTLEPLTPAMRKFYAEQAWASAKIEGFEPTAEDEALWNCYVDGEISGDEMLRIVVERAKRREAEEHLLAA